MPQRPGRMTIIAGLPVEYNDRFIRGIAVFAPWRKTPGIYHQSHGACLGRRSRTITVVDEQPQGMDMDPTCSLFTTGQCLGGTRPTGIYPPLTIFFHISTPLPC